jgi:hypothetical protein
MGRRATLPAGITIAVGRRIGGVTRWEITHDDLAIVTRGQSVTVADAMADAVAAAPAFALAMADAIDARIVALTARAAALRLAAATG